jgi:hypothetical protein
VRRPRACPAHAQLPAYGLEQWAIILGLIVMRASRSRSAMHLLSETVDLGSSSFLGASHVSRHSTSPPIIDASEATDNLPRRIEAWETAKR